MYNQIIQSNMANLSVAVHPASRLRRSPYVGIISEQHFHDDLEFLYVRSGCLKCISNNVTYMVKPGDIIFINSRIPHATESAEPYTSIDMIQFETSNFSSDAVSGISKYLSRFININKAPVVIFKADDEKNAELSLFLEAIFDEYIEKKPSYELYIKANILNIIAFLSRHDYLTDSSIFFDEKNIEKVLPALNYIDEHYDEQITLEDLSRVLNLNPSYFCRLFKKATNSTFVEYLNFVRVCKSEKKLSSSKESIAEISLNLGFSSVSYFNKVFKNIKGCTPTEYKKSKYALQ